MKFEPKVRIHNLEQQKDECISDYLDRAEELLAKLPTDNINIAMAILEGMILDLKGKMSFECNKDADFSFSTVERLIKAAYYEVGQLSLSDPRKSMRVSLRAGSGTSTDRMRRQVLLNTTNTCLELLQGMQS